MQHRRGLFVLLLCLLFGLSATSPRSWESIARRGLSDLSSKIDAAPKICSPPQPIFRLWPATTQSPIVVAQVNFSPRWERFSEPAIPCPRWTVSPEELRSFAQASDAASFSPELSLTAAAEPIAPHLPEVDQVTTPPRTDSGTPDLPVLAETEDSESAQIVEVSGRHDRYTAWDMPDSLWPWLDAVAADPNAAAWSSAVRNLIAELAYIQTRGSRDIEPVLTELRRMSSEVDQLAASADPDMQSKLRRTQHALLRRLDIWELVAAIEREQPRPMPLDVAQSHERIASRAEIPGLLHERTVQPRELLASLERYEASGLASDARRIVEIERQLALSLSPADLALGKQIESHYRNCNLRIAVTDDLINRLVPQPRPIAGQVRERILNLPVRGHNTTNTELKVRLAPDPRRLHLTLEAVGQVSSWTAASSGPARLHSRSQGNFWVEKSWTIDGAGLQSAPATARAENSSRLRRIESDFDSVPLVGSMVRGLIRRAHAARSPEAEAEVRRKIRSTAADRFESEANAQVAVAKNAFSQRVLTPLANLSLDLKDHVLETTADRLVSRVRLSSDGQLGAHTPRPRAPGDSLLSVQIHQTALNNCLESLDLNGRTFTLDELHRTLLTKLNRPPESMPEPQHEDVEITFAAKDAVRVQCADGRIEVTLSIARLSTANRDWHNFAMRVFYRPGSTGLTGELVREGSIYLSGEGLSTRSQIALRGVAAKVFPRNRGIPLVPESIANHPKLKDCEITQFEIQDGWIGVAVGPRRGARGWGLGARDGVARK